MSPPYHKEMMPQQSSMGRLTPQLHYLKDCKGTDLNSDEGKLQAWGCRRWHGGSDSQKARIIDVICQGRIVVP